MTGGGIGWRLSQEDVRGWIESLLGEGGPVVAPVEEDGCRHFRAVSSADEVCLDGGTSAWSPKEFLFPRTEVLCSYSLDSQGVRLEDPPLMETEQVLFGLRPCDVAALRRLDQVLLSRQVDPFYARRRELSTVISLACEAMAPECFCTAVGGSPVESEGSDVQLVELDGVWLTRALTAKGEAAVDGCRQSWAPATAEDWVRVEEVGRSLVEEGDRTPLSLEWAPVLEGAFEDPVWENLALRCVGCAVCAYVCPTCTCFDVNDEGDASSGVRQRCWDSCGFAQFTRHASGHNPRADQAGRYRQRVLHKFAYFPADEGGFFGCVGCGRCLTACPVGLDIYEAVRTVVASSREEESGG